SHAARTNAMSTSSSSESRIAIAAAGVGTDMNQNYSSRGVLSRVRFARHSRSGACVQSSMSLLLHVVPGHHSAEREATVVVEAIVNPSVEARHRLLFGDSGELGAL